MKKNTVRLTESQLHQVIKESVKKVLKEGFGDGHIERALQQLIDTYMDTNNEEESSAIDCFYYLWERAGYGNVKANYDTYDLNHSGIIFQDEEGKDVIIISPEMIYISPIFDYSNSTIELKKWNKCAIILQKEVINCIESV